MTKTTKMPTKNWTRSWRNMQTAMRVHTGTRCLGPVLSWGFSCTLQAMSQVLTWQLRLIMLVTSNLCWDWDPVCQLTTNGNRSRQLHQTRPLKSDCGVAIWGMSWNKQIPDTDWMKTPGQQLRTMGPSLKRWRRTDASDCWLSTTTTCVKTAVWHGRRKLPKRSRLVAKIWPSDDWGSWATGIDVLSGPSKLHHPRSFDLSSEVNFHSTVGLGNPAAKRQTSRNRRFCVTVYFMSWLATEQLFLKLHVNHAEKPFLLGLMLGHIASTTGKSNLGVFVLNLCWLLYDRQPELMKLLMWSTGNGHWGRSMTQQLLLSDVTDSYHKMNGLSTDVIGPIPWGHSGPLSRVVVVVVVRRHRGLRCAGGL